MNLIVSKGHHGAVLTVVDRKSKHVWLTALSGKAAAETTRALIRLLESITNSVNDYRRLRQGVRGARRGGRGARPELLLRAAVPLVGAGPERVHEQLVAAELAKVEGVQAPAAEARAAGAGTAQQPAAQGAGLPDAERGVSDRVRASPRHGTRASASALKGRSAPRGGRGRPGTARNGLLRAKKPTIRPHSSRIGLQTHCRRC